VGPLVSDGLMQADLNIQQFENFLVISFVFSKILHSHSQSLTSEELEDLAAQLIQKQL
jgi:hypothetical protein